VDGPREETDTATLAAAPDFRYVGLEPAHDLGGRVAASLFLAGGGVGVGLLRELGLLSAAVGAFLAATGLALVWRRVTAPMRRIGTQRVPFAIVPWGVLVDDAESPRVLRWAAVRSLTVHTMYGRDASAMPKGLRERRADAGPSAHALPPMHSAGGSSWSGSSAWSLERSAARSIVK